MTLRDQLKARPHAPQSEPATFIPDYADGQSEYFEIEELEKMALADLQRRIADLEAELQQMRETMQNWTGD